MRKHLFVHGKKPGVKDKTGNINVVHAKTIGRSLFDVTDHNDDNFNLTDINACAENYQHYDIFTKQTRIWTR